MRRFVVTMRVQSSNSSTRGVDFDRRQFTAGQLQRNASSYEAGPDYPAGANITKLNSVVFPAK